MDRPWFDQDSGTVLLDEYLLDMDSYQRIVEDGTITDDELVEQTQRVASLLRRPGGSALAGGQSHRDRNCGDDGVHTLR
jgi:hypothetical protein